MKVTIEDETPTVLLQDIEPGGLFRIAQHPDSVFMRLCGSVKLPSGDRSWSVRLIDGEPMLLAPKDRVVPLYGEVRVRHSRKEEGEEPTRQFDGTDPEY